ncbi:MAG: tripartite tricarboxylate transporter substrate binding protein, partial [Variibacter sp.]|nr:tripartite tricarboxylate transporter substrate binding protein [Variibacter sp.]
MRLLAALAAIIMAVSAKPALAQSDYPNRTVRIVVPYGAGGATDVMARLFAKELSARLGQPFIVENRAGAATNIAAATVFRAAPDGYTLLVSTIASNALNKWTYKNLDYDPDAFVPVAMMGQNTFYLVVPAASPARSVQDLVRMAREKPDGLIYASNGVASPNHLLTELFRQKAGIANLLHVPFKGSAESNLAVIAGRVDFMFDGSAIQQVIAGQLKALAVAFPQRWPTQGEIPTMGEQGFPDVTISTFFGLVAPPGTPSVVVDRL